MSKAAKRHMSRRTCSSNYNCICDIYCGYNIAVWEMQKRPLHDIIAHSILKPTSVPRYAMPYMLSAIQASTVGHNGQETGSNKKFPTPIESSNLASWLIRLVFLDNNLASFPYLLPAWLDHNKRCFANFRSEQNVYKHNKQSSLAFFCELMVRRAYKED